MADAFQEKFNNKSLIVCYRIAQQDVEIHFLRKNNTVKDRVTKCTSSEYCFLLIYTIVKAPSYKSSVCSNTI